MEIGAGDVLTTLLISAHLIRRAQANDFCSSMVRESQLSVFLSVFNFS